MGSAEKFYNDAWHQWTSMIDNSPAPFHRRRIIRKYIRHLKDINSIADIGCGNGSMINYLRKPFQNVNFSGFDISSNIIEKNKNIFNNDNWKVFDLDKDDFDDKFDVVICTEVLEHVVDWKKALSKLINASNNMCIISVPSGKVFKIDKKVGHYRHFNSNMIKEELEKNDSIDYKIFYWGFPFHQLYKFFLNLFPDKTYHTFTKSKYSMNEKIISSIINFLFYFNLKSKFETNQMFIVIRKTH